MTPLTPSERAEIVAKAQQAKDTPAYVCHADCRYSQHGYHVTECAEPNDAGLYARAAFRRAASPETIQRYEATVVALALERDAAQAHVRETILEERDQRERAEAAEQALTRERAQAEALRAALDMIASPGTIEDFGNGWAVGIARAALAPQPSAPAKEEA